MYKLLFIFASVSFLSGCSMYATHPELIEDKQFPEHDIELEKYFTPGEYEIGEGDTRVVKKRAMEELKVSFPDMSVYRLFFMAFNEEKAVRFNKIVYREGYTSENVPFQGEIQNYYDCKRKAADEYYTKTDNICISEEIVNPRHGKSLEKLEKLERESGGNLSQDIADRLERHREENAQYRACDLPEEILYYLELEESKAKTQCRHQFYDDLSEAGYEYKWGKFVY